MAKTNWDKIFLTIRSNQANDPNTWLRTARGLKISADLVYDKWLTMKDDDIKLEYKLLVCEPDLAPVWQMLYGLAIENLIKGIYVCKEGALVKSETKDSQPGDLDKKLTFHDRNIDELLGGGEKYDLNQIDCQIIQRLEQYVISWGRYGVSKNIGSKERKQLSIDDKQYIPRYGVVKKNAQEILKKIKKEITQNYLLLTRFIVPQIKIKL